MQFATVCLTALSLAGLAHAAAGKPGLWSKSFHTGAHAELRVEADDGRVELRGGPSGSIEARVMVRGYQLGPGGVHVADHQSGDQVRIDVRVPRDLGWFSIGNRSVLLELVVPDDVTVDIHTRDGGILVNHVKGRMKLRSGDGRIEATRVDGSVEAETGDGQIRLNGRVDHLRLRTGDGSIEAELVPGSSITSGWEISTGDGHVTLRVPSNLNADLEAHTNDGDIEMDFPVTTRMGASNDLRGRIGHGGAPLRIRTGDGRIRILKD